MHIKQRPADFQVEEIIHPQTLGTGDYSLYRMEKRGRTTHDALAIVRERWKIDARRISVGGLKDRHAETVQHFSILRGPQRKLTHPNLHVDWLGQIADPFTSEQIAGNRFRIVVRALLNLEAEGALASVDEVRKIGVPNYFDDQRFGSATPEGEFFPKLLLLGKYDLALHLALTAPYAHERPDVKQEKKLLRQYWGDWIRLRDLLPRNRVIKFLAHRPDDWAGALQQLPMELRSLYLSAYQSHLWNRMLAGWLTTNLAKRELVWVPFRLHDLPMPKSLSPEVKHELSALRLPLHSARIRIEDDDPVKPYFDRILDEEEVTQSMFKLKGLRKLFFSKGDRAAWCMPEELQVRDDADELHRGKQKLTLGFTLPRGSYATLVVKRITRADIGAEEE